VFNYCDLHLMYLKIGYNTTSWCIDDFSIS